MDVSIIIVNWNTRDILRDCLRSVYEAAGDVSFEVIVIDNNSADGSADMVADEFTGVRLIRNHRNVGFAPGNNQGIAASAGRYVLLLNSDTVVQDGAVAKSVCFADAHPDAAVVGCRTVFGDGRLQYNCYTFPSLLNLALSLTQLARWFRRNRFFGRYRLTWWDYATARQVDAVAGCFMLVRLSAIDEVGPMSERYFMYSEDSDWCWRFRQRGWTTWYTPDAHIVHLYDASGSQAPAEMHLHQRRSMLMFLEMRSGRAVKAIANAMFCLASIARLPGLAVRRLLGGPGAESAKRQWELSAAALKFHLSGRRCPVQQLPRSSWHGGVVARLGILRLAKRTIVLLITLGYWAVARWSAGSRAECVVLYYHGVGDTQRFRFRRQLEWLREHTKVVRLSEAAAASTPGRRTCLTFDDALDNVRRNAVPILRELGLPATVFAVSDNLGRRPDWPIPPGDPDAEETVMTLEQLSQLPRELLDIGSHTVTHANLAMLSHAQVRRELEDSKRQLEAALDRPIETFSVPFGECHPETLRMAREAGYTTVVTCEPQVVRPGDATLGVGRFKVTPDDWTLEFRLKAVGAYRWRRAFRRSNRAPTAGSGFAAQPVACARGSDETG